MNTHPGNRRPKRNWSICKQSGKRRFRDRKNAKLSLKQARYVRATAQVNGVQCTWTVVREYSCEYCGGWHLTSRSNIPK